MAINVSSIRRPFVGKEVGIVFGILVAGTLSITGGFLPWYLSVLFATSLRNVYVASLGSGMLFYGVAVIHLYFQAVVLTTAYLLLRYAYERVQNRPQRNASI